MSYLGDFQPLSLADYTSKMYNSDGTSKFNPGNVPDESQQSTLDEIERKKQSFDQKYGGGSSGGPQGGGFLHQIGTQAAMAGASALASGAGGSGAMSAILGSL